MEREQTDDGAPAGIRIDKRFKRHADFTDRECRVLLGLLQGKTPEQIAIELGHSRRTTHNHLSHIYGKTCTRGQASLVLWAISHGLVARDEGRAA